MNKKIYIYSNILAWGIVFLLLGSYIFAWITPTQDPPKGNVVLEVGGGGEGDTTPSGSIIMYSGAWNFNGTGLGTDTLSGWALCNGNNGTPNLSDRFVMGTNTSTNLATTGGANSYSLTEAQLPSHTHSFTTGSSGAHTHTITISSAGAHTHKYDRIEYYAGKVTGSGGPYYGWKSRVSSNTGSSGAHTHSASSGSAGSHTHTGTTGSKGSGASISNTPAFIRLAYIMKI